MTEIERIRERLGKTVGTPWETIYKSQTDTGYFLNDILKNGPNSNFIAHAKKDIAYLLGKLESAKEVIREYAKDGRDQDGESMFHLDVMINHDPRPAREWLKRMEDE